MSTGDRLTAALPGPGPYPLDRWQPPFSGAMDLHIDADGVWHHDGVPLRRERLVRLFAQLLRREADGGYYLVSPVEKWRIRVDDAPLLAVDVDRIGAPGRGQLLRFTSNLDDRIDAGPARPIDVRYAAPDAPPRPYVYVRHGLWARITRAAFIRVADCAVDADGGCGVWSGGAFFRLDADAC